MKTSNNFRSPTALPEKGVFAKAHTELVRGDHQAVNFLWRSKINPLLVKYWCFLLQSCIHISWRKKKNQTYEYLRPKKQNQKNPMTAHIRL